MRTPIIAVGCLALSLIGTAQAEPGAAMQLSSSEMDAVTAGSMSYGAIPSAYSESSAVTTGSFTQATTSSQTLTSVVDPDELPAIANVYTTQTSATAIAVASGEEATATADTTGAVQQPTTSVIGNSINRTVSGRYVQISVTSDLYFGSFAYGGLFD